MRNEGDEMLDNKFKRRRKSISEIRPVSQEHKSMNFKLIKFVIKIQQHTSQIFN